MTSTFSHREQVAQKREALRAKLASAVEHKADPLAVHKYLVNWTLKHYSDHSESGLLELLEETLRKFKDDVRYKSGDLRYVKLWILFANYVEKPVDVYAYMLREGIGKPYALFFEEYTKALEREKRFAEADTVVNLSIQTQAKPFKHLKAFHDAYTSRRAAEEQLPANVSPFRDIRIPYAVNIIRTHPLKNMTTQYAGSTGHTTAPTTCPSDLSITTTQAPSTGTVRPNPYARLHAPSAPGKRPEKLQFDLTLLLDSDCIEYCFEEARARHLGLLGKRWAPPPPPNPTISPQIGLSDDSNIRERSIKVDFNDRGTKPRQSVTVTINTKQALVDVFDMYNSPVRERTDANSCEVEARTRIAESDKNVSTSTLLPFRDENEEPSTKPRPFQQYVDQRRENVTPGALKFTPAATKTPRSNAITPSATRRALAVKDITAPVLAFNVVRPEQKAATTVLPPDLRSFAEEQKPEEIDLLGGDDATVEQYMEEEDFTNPPPPLPASRSFVPFVDEQQDMPNARKNEDVFAPAAPKIFNFQVHRDENTSHDGLFWKPTLTSQSHSGAPFRPMRHKEDTQIGEDDTSDELLKRLDNEYEERQRFGKNGRFADFDPMTPITERTFEFTTSTRVADTPGSERSSMFDKSFVALDAQDAAERLAAELLEYEEEKRETGIDVVQNPLLSSELLDVHCVDQHTSSHSFFDRPQTVSFRVSDGFTIEPDHNNLLPSMMIDGSISHNLSQTFTVESGLELPNPCVPSDPAILSKIMSIFPSDANHRELGDSVANQLEKLRRFAEKRARRGSGASSSGRSSDGSDKLVLALDRDLFEVLDKLGEGGFGAVFMARIVDRENEVLEGTDRGDDDGSGELVAIKAVRPTNRWESFVLRRIISAIPHDLRRSIIRPHALYAYKDESYLILDLCHQGTLLEVINRAGAGVAQPGGGIDELLVMFFTIELLRIVQGLHDQGFIHGDLKIDNCLIRLEDIPGESSAWSSEYNPTGANGWAHKGIKLIDFGRTIDTKLFPAGQTFIADWKTDVRDCIEMREGRPWTFQADYAGLACIVYCMLFGKYIETVEVTGDDGARRIKPSQPMKRYWQANLWNRLFDALLNPCQLRPDGSLPITKELAALRSELETWLQTNCNKSGKYLKGLLKAIEVASLKHSLRK